MCVCDSDVSQLPLRFSQPWVTVFVIRSPQWCEAWRQCNDLNHLQLFMRSFHNRRQEKTEDKEGGVSINQQWIAVSGLLIRHKLQLLHIGFTFTHNGDRENRVSVQALIPKTVIIKAFDKWKPTCLPAGTHRKTDLTKESAHKFYANLKLQFLKNISVALSQGWAEFSERKLIFVNSHSSALKTIKAANLACRDMFLLNVHSC